MSQLLIKNQDGIWQNIVAIKGDKGDKGEKGDRGADGTMTFEELTVEQKESLKGEKGKDGVDGISPTISVNENNAGYELTITDKNGTQTVNIKNGKDGNDGADGSSSAVDLSDYYTKEEINEKLDNIEVPSGDNACIIEGTYEDCTNKVLVRTVSENVVLPELPTFEGGTRLYASLNYDTDGWLESNMLQACMKDENGNLVYKNYKVNTDESGNNSIDHILIPDTHVGTIDDYMFYGLDYSNKTTNGKLDKSKLDGYICATDYDEEIQTYKNYEFTTIKPLSGTYWQIRGFSYNVADVKGELTIDVNTIYGSSIWIYLNGNYYRHFTEDTKITIDVSRYDDVYVLLKYDSYEDNSADSLENSITVMSAEYNNVTITFYTTDMNKTNKSSTYSISFGENGTYALSYLSNRILRYSDEPIYSRSKIPLANYVQNNIYTKEEVDKKIPSLEGYLKYKIVSTLPDSQQEGVLYLVTE